MGVNGRPLGDPRGNSMARRRRRIWLLSIEAGWGGDGETVPCWDCGVLLEFDDLFVDRIIRGEDGGRYTNDNVAPHCCPCSGRQGQARSIAIVVAKRRAS